MSVTWRSGYYPFSDIHSLQKRGASASRRGGSLTWRTYERDETLIGVAWLHDVMTVADDYYIK